MSRVAVFLRAINVGGRRVTNDQLVALVTAAGFADVSAYQAAGNLLLDTGRVGPPAVEETVEAALAAGLGYTSEVFVRTVGELADTITASPFDDAELAEAAGKPQVGFFRTTVPSAVAAQVDALSTPTDVVTVIGRELHWLPKAGVGRSPLDLAAVAEAIGPLTVRTLGTVMRIHAKLAS